ncbi:hypothetical protein [Alkalihalobacterium elongatum]|uniref:hypothetical protein n=1 Tax=Alkalihalobacterium elongatum TaxID=2675466 RepID=UPI001C1F2B16|nr:hypothetical protein [Alkalihalobacterium elongatum]
MTDGRHEYYSTDQTPSMHEQCTQHMYYHVTFSTTDGQHYDGIIEDVGADSITALVGEDVLDREGEEGTFDRQYGYGYGYPGRYRRFRRRQFPLAALTALALLPYVVPPPYPYPPYPYPYPYPYFYPYY